MIKINLALKKQASALGSAKASQKSKAGDSILQRLLPSLFRTKTAAAVNATAAAGSATAFEPRRLLAPAVAVVAALFLADSIKNDELGKLDQELQVRHAEKAKLESDLAKLKGFEQIKAQLEADEKLIRTKMIALQTLQTDRSSSFDALRVLAEVIPPDTWLGQFKIENAKGSLLGASLTYQSVSDFMRRLEETPLFQNVQLKTTKQDASSSTGLQQRAVFELQFQKRDGAAAKGGSL